MAPNDVSDPETVSPERERLRAIVNRLKEVRRKCGDTPGVAGQRNAAVEGLDAVLSDLKACLDPSGELMEVEVLDLRLATVEELIEATGSPGVARVIASIRSSLVTPSTDAIKEEEPPPPRRFQPSPTSAVRRRRPRPNAGRRPAPAPPRKRRFGRLILTVLIVGAIAAASFFYLRLDESGFRHWGSSESDVIERPVFSPRSTSTDPISGPSQSGFSNRLDLHEEEMAHFTFEISLAESSLKEGNLNESLKHFAAAAAIDRQHHRVVGMGKALIANMLYEADLAYDNGNRELAGKKVEYARSLARGLQLVGSSGNNSTRISGEMIRFEEISPSDGEALLQAVGHQVRLILKTREVIFGYLIEIRDGILILDAYSGAKGPGIDASASILASTVKEMRVYDVR